MKRKEIQELKIKPQGELAQLLVVDREKLRKLKLELAAGKVKNVREEREVRKRIARTLTFMHLHGKEN